MIDAQVVDATYQIIQSSDPDLDAPILAFKIVPLANLSIAEKKRYNPSWVYPRNNISCV